MTEPVTAQAPAPAPPHPARRRRRERTLRPSTFWGIREAIPDRLRRPLVVASLCAPLVVWVALYASGAVSPLFLPSPVAVVRALGEWAASGDMAVDVAASVRRVAYGFGLALLVSIPLGLALGSFRSVQALVEPMISVVRYMPATAFIPLLLIWFGLDEAPKVALIFLGTVFFNTLMTADTVWQVPKELIQVSYTLGASRATAFWRVIFPHCLPGMVDAARVNLAAAWNLIVVAELLAADEGLGLRITRAQRVLETDLILAVVVVIGLLGVAADVGLRVLRNRLSPWAR
ncbi:MAG: ABC transporter permease [Egibacteraceae bacterium]